MDRSHVNPGSMVSLQVALRKAFNLSESVSSSEQEDNNGPTSHDHCEN